MAVEACTKGQKSASSAVVVGDGPMVDGGVVLHAVKEAKIAVLTEGTAPVEATVTLPRLAVFEANRGAEAEDSVLTKAATVNLMVNTRRSVVEPR